METRILNETEYELSKALWEECFGDGRSFIDWYYKERSKPEYVLGAFEGGELVSMLHMIPVRMRFGGGTSDVCMVSGVCTRPDMRRRGVCGELFQKAFPIMRERGFEATALQPFDPAFYERFGYRSFIFRQSIRFSGRGRGRAASADPKLLSELYSEFTRDMDGCSVRDEAYFESFIREYSAPDARLAASAGGCAAGYCEEGVFHCTELFFTEGADAAELLPEGFEEYVFPLPKGRKPPTGCVPKEEEFSMIMPLDERFRAVLEDCVARGSCYGFDRY